MGKGLSDPSQESGWKSHITNLLPRGPQRTGITIGTSATLRAFRAIFSPGTGRADLPLQARKEEVRGTPYTHTLFSTTVVRARGRLTGTLWSELLHQLSSASLRPPSCSWSH